ncbi:hypothetical protein [Streptomyces sp. NPDC051776]|uniref:hypothetical protein n=1 Tax=Streptomyces sp. NPDC051776 TaxID=3155414 RepID=UPI00344AA10B
MTRPHMTDGSWWPERGGALPSARREPPVPTEAEADTDASAYGEAGADGDASVYGRGRGDRDEYGAGTADGARATYGDGDAQRDGGVYGSERRLDDRLAYGGSLGAGSSDGSRSTAPGTAAPSTADDSAAQDCLAYGGSLGAGSLDGSRSTAPGMTAPGTADDSAAYDSAAQDCFAYGGSLGAGSSDGSRSTAPGTTAPGTADDSAAYDSAADEDATQDGTAYDSAVQAGVAYDDAAVAGRGSLAAARQRIADRRSEGAASGPSSATDGAAFDPLATQRLMGAVPAQGSGTGADGDADRTTGSAASPASSRPGQAPVPTVSAASVPTVVPPPRVEPGTDPAIAPGGPVEPGPGKSPRTQARRPARLSARRGPADPVKALMHRHRALCERAIDPLEIAAGLEAHGVTDRTAARFRHRDVFSLAEELYARVPRAETHAGRPRAAAPDASPAPRSRRLLYLLPGAGAACAAATLGAEPFVTAGQPVRLGIAAASAAAVAVALRLCVRRGPLSLRGAAAGTAPLWTCWLLGYLLVGDALLAQWAGAHGPLWPPSAAPEAAASAAPAVVALAFAVVPAAWCARWFAVRARRRLAASRGLEDFSAGIRPSLPAVAVLFLSALMTLLLAARAATLIAGGWYGAMPHDASYAESTRDALLAAAAPAALGALVFVARLLAVHGRPKAAARGLAAACSVEALALGTAVAARLPGCGPIGRPLGALVTAYGPGAVPLAACATAAIALLVHATVVLSRAEAHARPTAGPR